MTRKEIELLLTTLCSRVAASKARSTRLYEKEDSVRGVIVRNSVAADAKTMIADLVREQALSEDNFCSQLIIGAAEELAGREKKLPTISQVLDDPASSYWLKHALSYALTRDPVDAANEAGLLADLLTERATQALKKP